MESKYLNFLLDENKVNRIANEVGLCKRIRKFTPMGLASIAINLRKFNGTQNSAICFLSSFLFGIFLFNRIYLFFSITKLKRATFLKKYSVIVF